MTVLSLVLLIAIQSLLANYAYASSKCRPLNSTMFNDCIKAGYNVSGVFNSSGGQHEISSLIASMQKKFKNCSPLSALISCSVHLPKCSKSRLPLTEAVCKNFVRDCQNGSQEIEGLIALFRGLCKVLSPNTGADDDVKCKPLNISQCVGAGYDFTIVSREYQKIVESDARAIFQNSGANSTLRKIICMELAPPCDVKNKSTLLAPCKSTCHAAYNHSKSQFLKIFKSPEYCSVLPDKKSMVGKDYCAFQAWSKDNAGYWPSSLWTFLGKADTTSTPGKTTPTGLSSTPNTTTPTGLRGTSKTTTPTGLLSTPNTTTPTGLPSTPNTTTPTGLPSTPNTTTPTGLPSTPNTTTPTGLPSTPNTTTPTGLPSTPNTTTPTGFPSTPNTTTPTGLPSTPNATTPTGLPSTSNATTPTGLPSTPNATTPTGLPSTPNTTTPTGLPSTPNATTPTGLPSTPNTTTPTGLPSTPNTTTPTGLPSTPNTTTPTGSPNTLSSTTLSGSMTTPGSTQTTLGSKGGPGIQAKSDKKLSAGVIAGIVLGVLVIVAAIAFGAIFFRRYIKTRAQYRHSLMVDMDEL